MKPILSLEEIAQCRTQSDCPFVTCRCDHKISATLGLLCDAAEDSFALRTVASLVITAAADKNETAFDEAFRALRMLVSCHLKEADFDGCPDTCIRHTWPGKCPQCSADVTLTMASVHSVGALCAACSPK